MLGKDRCECEKTVLDVKRRQLFVNEQFVDLIFDVLEKSQLGATLDRILSVNDIR